MRKVGIISSIITIIFTLGLSISVYATTCGGSWGTSNCDTVSPYCAGNTCTLNSGVDAVKTAMQWQIVGNNMTLETFIKSALIYFMGFVSLVALVYIIYAGFQLMTGGWDEEKMKKTRNIILYVILGVVLMWLARPIVIWVVDSISKSWKIAYEWSIAPPANAVAYTESDADTYNEYRNKAKTAIELLENELRLNESVSTTSIQQVKTIIQGAYDRLPDYGEMGSENDSAKRTVDSYLDLAMKNPTSTTHVGNAISRATSFIDRAKINQISGDISATPVEGNAPLSVSFRAEGVNDPSGTTPNENNYIWWMREAGWYRRELKRGASLSYTFTKEGNYTVFLDVVSGSRNSKGRTDVLPLSISKQISVKPKLGEIVLLVNGVNVSNMDVLKISPTIGNMGVILDASASRAIGNGTITETTWDFGNWEKSTNPGAPIVERQIYANPAPYALSLTIKTNEWQTYKKELQLLVQDPSASIKLNQSTAYVWEDITMSAVSNIGDDRNVAYTWQVQDEDSKKSIKGGEGNTFTYRFDKVGNYIVSLTAKNANGKSDSDSKIITIESHEPIVSIDSIKAISPEKPNTILFDASRSIDPDTNSNKNLSYTWRIDGQKVVLDNPDTTGAKGSYTFDTIWSHTVAVTASNTYGKVTTVEQKFDVTSTLAVNLLINPTVAKQWTPINFVGQSPNADFFEWNFSDGSAIVSGTTKTIQHVFNRSGVFDVTLTVNRNGGSETNTITRKVYVADSDSPMAIIATSNGSDSVYQEADACGDKNTLIINRSDTTTFDGSSSINIDGTPSGLTYTWKYFGKVKTTPSISEKFEELWCFPIELTVRSNKNGATHSATQYVKLANNPPLLTNVTTSVDSGKKDAQKVIVRVTANGARDPDGVITSYIWYYKTESDPEPQNIQISQKNEMTFVLPNITEKYYFGVILEDNDGAKTNSMDSGGASAPLIIDNANGNIYLPLITFTTTKTNANVGEKVNFAVDAKTIIGTNVTTKSDYAWDFDGDGRIDKKTSTPGVEYVYTRAGDYNVKVRVTNNGVSNTKYQTIHVRNKLKAAVDSYKLTDGQILLINASEWVYNKAKWDFGATTSEALTSMMIASGTTLSTGRLTIASNTDDTSSVDIDLSKAETIMTSSSGVIYQSFPKATADTITLKNPSDVLSIAFFWNDADTYAVDTDTSIDTNLDGIPDNDHDNASLESYKDGSLYTIHDMANSPKKERTIRILLLKNSVPVAKKDIKIIFDYISGANEQSADLNGSGSIELTEYDKAKLNELSQIIRETGDVDRIVLMQRYNTLVENWNNPFDKAKSLIDLQESVVWSTVSTDQKTKISKIIDELLIGDSKSTDEISVAVKLIRDLIPKESPNYSALTDKLSAIEAHPTLLSENKILGQEMLKLIENDITIPDKYKLHIRNQLLLIVNGGSSNTTTTETKTTSTPSTGGGILGFIGGFVKVFLILIGIILGIGIIGYIFYRFSRKDENIGFQDFLIDSVFHSRKTTPAEKPLSPVVNVKSTETAIKVDPLTSYVPPPAPPPSPQVISVEKTLSKVDPLATEEPSGDTAISQTEDTKIPSWLKTPTVTAEVPESAPAEIMGSTAPRIHQPDASTSIPEWLKPKDTTLASAEATVTVAEKETVAEEKPSLSSNDDAMVPDWLKPINTPGTPENNQESAEESTKLISANNDTTSITQPSDTLPDWLVDSIQDVTIPEVPEPKEVVTIEAEPKKTVKATWKKTTWKVKWGPLKTPQQKPRKGTDNEDKKSDIPSWLQ